MFSETDSDERFTLTDEETTYQLLLRKDKSPKDDFYVTLRIPAGKARAVVTGRNGYRVFRNGEEIGPETKIVEVGAGLSSFLPDHVSENGIAPENTPVVIDPIDYEQCGQLLTEAEGRSRETDAELHPARRRIRTLLQRCNTYRSDRIQTIPMTLADAVERHPELAHSADVLVDVCATDIYYRTQMDIGGCTTSDEIQERKNAEMARLHACLLKEGGRMIPS